jgi:endonuclease YncB( thermonuclease family)
LHKILSVVFLVINPLDIVRYGRTLALCQTGLQRFNARMY